MKKIFWLLLALPIVGTIVWLMLPQRQAVECALPERRTVHEYIAEEGKTRLASEYILDVPVSAGNVGFLPSRVLELPWEVGDVVQKGQVVARMNDADLRKDLESLEALIAQSKARVVGVDVSKPKPEDFQTAEVLAQESADALAIAQREAEIARFEHTDAQRDYARMAELLEQGIVSQAQYDAAEQRVARAGQNTERSRLAIDAARKVLERAKLASQRVIGSVDDNEYLRDVYQAEIARLEVQRRQLMSDLDETEIRSPITGPVLEKYVENSRVLSPGAALLKIGDLRSMEIECDVLSEEIVQVEVGDPVEITGKALRSETVMGTVKRIYPSAFKRISSLGIEQQRVKVLIDFDNTALGLRAGTRVDVRIVTGEAPDALALPERAAFRQNDAWHVFVVEGGTARLRPIEVGLRNDTWIELRAGLGEGDLVVIEPGNDLEEGARVRESR